MIKSIILVVTVLATIYHADPKQCNADYLTTASLKKINPKNPAGHRWIAVSRDLEKYGFTFGVEVCIENAGEMNGIWTIEDRMNKRFTNKIDFLVDNEIVLGKWEGVIMTLNSER